MPTNKVCLWPMNIMSEDSHADFIFEEDDDDDLLAASQLLESTKCPKLPTPSTSHGSSAQSKSISPRPAATTSTQSAAIITETITPGPSTPSSTPTLISPRAAKTNSGGAPTDTEGMPEPRRRVTRVLKRKIPGPAGFRHGDDVEDSDYIEVKKAMEGPAWRSMTNELKFFGKAASERMLLKHRVEAVEKCPSRRPFMTAKYLTGVIVRIEFYRLNGQIVLADRTGKMVGDLAQSVIDDHRELLKVGSILLLSDVLVKFTNEDRCFFVNVDNVDAIFSPLSRGFEARYLGGEVKWPQPTKRPVAVKFAGTAGRTQREVIEIDKTIDLTEDPAVENGDDLDTEIGAQEEPDDVVGYEQFANEAPLTSTQSEAEEVANAIMQEEGAQEGGDRDPRIRRIGAKNCPLQ